MDNVIVIQPSARYVLLRILATMFILDTLFATGLVLTLLLFPEYDRKWFGSILLVIHTFKFTILAFLTSDVIIRYLSNRYYLVKHHLIIDKGLVTADQKVYELHQIRKINVFQDWAGNSMNYGNLHMIFGDKGYEESVIMMNIAEPRKIAKELEKYLT